MKRRQNCYFNTLRHLIRDTAGGAALTFGLIFPATIGAAGAALDYSNMRQTRAQMQAAADSSALAASREFRLGNAGPATISAVAALQAKSILAETVPDARISPSVDTKVKSVTVEISASVKTYVMKVLNSNTATITVTATARISGGSPICVIGLDQEGSPTLFLQKNARLSAPGCAVYSDSTRSGGLQVQDKAQLTAAFVCSSGGVKRVASGTVTPAPQADCPNVPDPLAARKPPAVASKCDFFNFEVVDRNAVLSPGVYCGGLKVLAHRGKSANVTFNPGIYVIKDGPLTVGGNSQMFHPTLLCALPLDGDAFVTGTDVGFYFYQSPSMFSIIPATITSFLNDGIPRLGLYPTSHVSLSAAKTGELAGILFFEDRRIPRMNQHFITSDDARMLLGTIYLPRGELTIDANKPVADRSPYTIIVSRQFNLNEGPTMVLNSDYASTTVPVPEGLGPNFKSFLSK